MRRPLILAAALLCSAALAQTPPAAPKQPAPKPAAKPAPKPQDPGVLPLGADAKPLNLDFETGDLKDWTATGDAFAKQPVKGDTVFPRRSDMHSNHQGDYWIGSYEVAGDKPTGTLTSVPFECTQPYASFLIGGGPNPETRVEVVLADTNEIIFKMTGSETEEMYRAAVNLELYKGRKIFVRIVDQHTGHWGHINFDDFRFHAGKSAFQKPAKQPPPPLDVVKNEGLTPEQAVKEMTLPDGFSATVFAAEPQVNQPVAFCIDPRGRLWVAEAWGYPKRQPEGQGKDRILIFEDTDGDGKADKRTVFKEGLNLVSGLEVGFGGVWVGAAPYLMFIPDKDGDDKPDGEPQVLLDGWHYEDTHETLNAFNWGPDGWLYGCQGVFTHSRVGKPGTPDAQRTPINAGVWRYHPTRHVFEIFAEGTSNPWGVDFNDHGQALITACVIPHLYHVIQGARYQRQAGQHFNPYTFKDISTIADHVHYAGAGGPHAGNNRSDAAGGGHAHCGAMVYLGNAWPQQYRDVLFMNNIHGNRVNTDLLQPAGSGYIGRHGADFLKMNDKWSRLINLKYGPDGNVYLIDWYDKQACHRNEPEIWDRTNGRIYKISYRNGSGAAAQEQRPQDLAKLPDGELIGLLTHANEWYSRMARRVLQQRNPGAPIQGAILSRLNETARSVPHHLRYLWALHAVGGTTPEVLLNEMKHADPYVRGWAIQLALEQRQASPEIVAELARLATSDPSPIVRLYLASAAQRLPVQQRWEILKGLLGHAEDAQDHNLPLMVWYALEPCVPVDAKKALQLAATSKLPGILQYTSRRAASLK